MRIKLSIANKIKIEPSTTKMFSFLKSKSTYVFGGKLGRFVIDNSLSSVYEQVINFTTTQTIKFKVSIPSIKLATGQVASRYSLFVKRHTF